MTSTVLQDAKTSIDAKFDTAISSAQALEGTPSQQTNPTICDLLEILKEDAQDLITIIDEEMADHNCGQLRTTRKKKAAKKAKK